MDGVGYAGLMCALVDWLRDPMTEKDSECEEHFDASGG